MAWLLGAVARLLGGELSAASSCLCLFLSRSSVCALICLCLWVCSVWPFLFFFFFFKQKTAYEIHCVTGVQTCALPISVRPNPEPDLVPPFISGRRPRGDIWYQARRGPENITRAATRARTGIGAGPGPAARPCPPGRPRSLSRPTRRSIARPHNRNGLGRGGHDERWDGHVDLHRLRDWGNRRNRDGGRGPDVFRSRGGRCWRREGEPADRGTAAATTPASWTRASTASPLEQRGAAPQHENGDGPVRQE